MKIERGTTQSVNEGFLRGWPVGYMAEGLGKTRDLEIKLWEYDTSLDYPTKLFDGTEFIVVYGGVLQIDLEKGTQKRSETVRAMEYIILEPGIAKHVSVREAPAFGVTVRWPSGPGVNKVIK